MTKWNDAQLKAITTRHKNVLVSASAGSGKTTVLIERLVRRVLDDGISIDHILAMTFTEAAASEMKKRLAAKLHEKRDSCDDEQLLAYIDVQLSKLPSAHISTIHSFCLSILKDFYYLINLNPERVNNILDTASIAQLKKQALDHVFQDQLACMDDTFLTLTQMFSPRPESDEALYALISSLATLASSKPDPDAFLKDIADSYQSYTDIKEIPSYIYDYFMDYLRVQSDIYESSMMQVQRLFDTRYVDEDKKYTQFQKKYAGIDELKKAAEQKDYEAFRTALINLARVIIPTSPDKEDKEYASLRKRIQDQEDLLLGQLSSSFTLLHDINDLSPYIARICTMVKTYRSYYQTLKEEYNGIDFDDMEHLALQILHVNDGQAAKHYQTLFEEIMVDEFQDSNDVQNELVMLIARKDNVFRVGDIKQSIYGFRHARPQLMKGLIDHRQKLDEIIYLSNNYRSKQMIVDFNNELFQELMNVPGFSCSFTPQDYAFTGIPSQGEQNVPIHYHALMRDEIKEDAGYSIPANDLKASYIAMDILRKKESDPNLKWNDFVVLVRANARKDDMRIAFDELSIPYFIDVNHGFYQSDAVQVVLSTLRACVNPNDDISFCAMLLSPLFQLSSEDLAYAAQHKESDASYYEYYKEHPFADFHIFEELHEHLYRFTLTQMIDEVYNIADFYQELTSMQDKTNLDQLYAIASDYQSQDAETIISFLEIIQTICEEQIAEAIPIGSEDDVVRVMSIHQSKGLQFPIVYLWSTSRQIPIDFKDFYLHDVDLGLALKHIDLPHRFLRSTIHRIAMEHKKNLEELEEEMRILYVATTRAQQQMHIVDCISSLDAYQGGLSLASIYERKGYTSWILQAFLKKNSQLFQISTITQLWSKHAFVTETKEIKEILRYSEPAHSYEEITPTQSKNMQIPEFNLHSSDEAMKRGSAIHKLIELLPYEHYQESNIKENAKQIGYEVKEHDIHQLTSLHDQPIFEKANTFPNIYHELPFAITKDDHILHGSIDFAAISDQEIIIIDFKTDHIEDASKFIDAYHEQLEAYIQAMKVMYPNLQISAYIYSLYLNAMIQVPQNEFQLEFSLS